MTTEKFRKSPGGPGRLPSDQAALVDDRLLDAAFELMKERSFSNITMEQIARWAGASTKTLYRRYPSKADVLQALVNRIFQRVMASAGLDLGMNDPRAAIVGLGLQVLRNFSGEAAGLIQIALSEARYHPEVGRVYNAILGNARALYTRALEQWQARGLLPDMKDPAMSATLLISMLTDMARIRTAMGEPMHEDEIAAWVPFATDVFLRGCGFKQTK